MQLHEKTVPARVAGDLKKKGTMTMDSLLADMNHDIRTSMNGVRGMLELLLDTGLTPSQQKYARTAQHSVDALLESLERVVDMSLIESNNFRFNQAPFDLLQEMQLALDGKAANARARGIELSIHHPPSVRLIGDGARLREAVSALGDLALQCAAGERLTIALGATYISGGSCRITLDARAFQLSEDGARMVSMLNRTTAPSPGAAGRGGKEMLSMAVCGRLVEMMNGSISVDQANTPGAVFRLSIVLSLAENALRGARSLILSERSERWKAALAPLSRLGLQVDAFDSVEDGLGAIEKSAKEVSRYKTILIGRNIRGLDAGVLVNAIKENHAYRNTLFVLLDDADNSATPHVDGFGAQLAASSSPAEVESTVASFCIASAGGPSHSGVAPVPVQKDDGRLSRFSDYNILVAEDNPVNQQVAARMLEKLGCTCALATDGLQAVEMHTWKRFDLILMDCDMPMLDGLEATQRIRASEGAGRRTPIIALTACTGQGERERCIAAGMDDFLSKPIRPQMLADVLARWLPQAATVAHATLVPACEDELEEVSEMFGADFADLSALYQNDGPPRLAALREAFAARDCAKVAKVAHAMAGSSASIGATGLCALCKAVENSAKAGSLDDFEQRIAVIEAEYRRVCGKLQSLLTR